MDIIIQIKENTWSRLPILFRSIPDVCRIKDHCFKWHAWIMRSKYVLSILPFTFKSLLEPIWLIIYYSIFVHLTYFVSMFSFIQILFRILQHLFQYTRNHLNKEKIGNASAVFKHSTSLQITDSLGPNRFRESWY